MNYRELESNLREILPELAEGEAQHILECVTDNVKIVQEPRTGLIMVQSADSFGVEFHLGEVLATVAEADCMGARGHATVMGDAPAKAVLAATVNALSRAGQPAPPEIASRVAAARKQWQAKQQNEHAMRAATRVRFESMAKE